MFPVGNYVQSKRTGNIGQVIGYGQQNLNNSHLSTIKVLVSISADTTKRGFVEEDLHSVWTAWPEP